MVHVEQRGGEEHVMVDVGSRVALARTQTHTRKGKKVAASAGGRQRWREKEADPALR